MRLSIKEKAGTVDTLRIYEKGHLTKEFLRNSALHPDTIEPEFKKEESKHFFICGKCRKEKESHLPLKSDEQV